MIQLDKTLPVGSVVQRMGIKNAEFDPEDDMVHLTLYPRRKQASPWQQQVEMDLGIEVIEALVNPKKREALVMLASLVLSDLREKGLVVKHDGT